MDDKQIESIATECADEAASQAGHPFDADGKSLLPSEPLPGDHEHLTDQLGREPTDDESELFADAYAEKMDHHRDGWDRVRRLEAVRDALDMDQAEFAEWMGVSGQQRVSEWKRGVRYPAIEKVQIAEMKVENPELWE